MVQLPRLPFSPGDDRVEITSIAVTRITANIIAVGTRDRDEGKFGGVYVLEDNTVPAWVDTGIGNYDVCALTFSPEYVRDSRLIAVITDEGNTFTSVKTGNDDWYSGVLARNNSGLPAPVIARSATIAFPDGYNPENSSESYYYVGINTNAGNGDVYKINTIAPDRILSTDLNIGHDYGQDDTDVSGLAVRRVGTDITLLAGAGGSASTFTSADGGKTWLISQKSPTGTADTIVRMPKDYPSTGMMYAATAGENSAISLSRDAGITWNQIGFIDATIEAISDLVPSPDYNRDKTMFLLTFGSGYSFWRTLDSGDTWERVLSASPDKDIMTSANLPRDYGNSNLRVFLAGESNGQPTIWESTDAGQSYCSRFTRDPATGLPFTIDAWTVAGAASLFTAGYDGNRAWIYRSDNSGFFYSNGAPVGEQPVNSIVLSPSYERDRTILAGNSNGHVFLSTDEGLSFQLLPVDAASSPLSGSVVVAFDPLFETNHTVYAASEAEGVFRFVVGSSRHWENIGATLPARAIVWQLFSGERCTLYAAATTADPIIERCLNPASSGAVFEKLSSGLNEDSKLSGLWTSGSRLWALDSSEMTLLTLYDSLTESVSPTSPENAASGIGSLISHSVKNVVLDWESFEGATTYDWQCSNDTDFSSIPEGLLGNTDSSYVRLPELEPATVYYWRVKASAPVSGPWSEKRAFTTCLDTEAVILQPESPSSGASDVPLNPVFRWTALVGAAGYELLADTDIDFTSPIIVRTGDFTLPTNTWRSDVTLENGVTYYWKVRATGSGSYSPWSSVGMFTTEPPLVETAKTPAEKELKEETPVTNTPVIETETVTPTVTLSITLMTTTATPVILSPAEPTLPTPVAAQNPGPDPARLSGLPGWIVYVVGGLLVIVILALIVVLAIVLKIRHIM
jgi:trimeric autotransporter adhesin